MKTLEAFTQSQNEQGGTIEDIKQRCSKITTHEINRLRNAYDLGLKEGKAQIVGKWDKPNTLLAFATVYPNAFAPNDRKRAVPVFIRGLIDAGIY